MGGVGLRNPTVLGRLRRRRQGRPRPAAFSFPSFPLLLFPPFPPPPLPPPPSPARSAGGPLARPRFRPREPSFLTVSEPNGVGPRKPTVLGARRWEALGYVTQRCWDASGADGRVAPDPLPRTSARLGPAALGYVTQHRWAPGPSPLGARPFTARPQSRERQEALGGVGQRRWESWGGRVVPTL